jgi:hypothetical protein
LDTLPFRLEGAGMFRSIIFNLTYSYNAPFRIRALEMDVTEGVT